MTRTFRSAILVATLMCFGACATPSLEIDSPHAITKDKIAQLQKGVTTRQEVERMFGGPEMEVPTPDGVGYFFKDVNLGSLWILYDDEGKVAKYKWSR